MADNSKVTAEDQALLNKFARSYHRETTMKNEVKDAQTLVENINEASDEVLLLDDEDAASIPCRIGNCFVHFNQDSLNEHLDAKKAAAEELIKVRSQELEKFTAELGVIKTHLYGKFGDKINLDSSDE